MPAHPDNPELENDKLEAASRAATRRAAREASLAARGGPKQIPVEVALAAPRLHPDNNPAWDDQNRVGVSYAPMGARRELAASLERGQTIETSQLDEMVYQYRISGLRSSDIAARIGPPHTEDSVNAIIMKMVKRMETQTPSEIRMLQTGRLEAIINMLWNMSTQGSVPHVEVLLKAIERLNKIYELESDKTRIEIDYITDAQTETMFRTVQMAVEAVVSVYSKLLDRAGVRQPDPEIIDGTVADALDSAATTILLAQKQPLILERQGKNMVPSAEMKRYDDLELPG